MISVRKLLLNLMPLTRSMPPVRESWQPVVRTLFFGYTHFADASRLLENSNLGASSRAAACLRQGTDSETLLTRRPCHSG